MLGGFLDNQEGCASNNPLGKKFFQMVYMKRVKVSKEDYRILTKVRYNPIFFIIKVHCKREKLFIVFFKLRTKRA